MENFEKELEILINKHSMENDSNTPDYILAEYLNSCLKLFNNTLKRRTGYYKRSGKEFDELYKKPETNLSELEKQIKDLDLKGEKLKKKLAEMKVKRLSISDEEIDKLAAWLKSDEGKQKIKENQEKAENFCKELDQNACYRDKNIN